MAKPAGALFYSPAQLSPVQLFQLVAGSFILADLDIVQFDAEQGGTGERELAIPFLADMDEIVVDAAELRFVARRHERAIAGYKVSAAPESKGVVLSLDRPARLLKVVIDAPPTAVPPAVHRLVVRGAEPKPSGGFDFGPPMFADPPFALDSPLYEPVLGGLRVTNFGGRAEITFPGTAGSGWLISLASGDEATKLKPLVFTPAVHSVTVDAAASDLTLAVPGEDADEDTVLWSSPGPLFPEAGVQVAAFTPVAQKRLASALESAATPAGAVTLPIPLRFEASSAGRIAIESKTLQAHYRVHPLGSEPVQASLAGGWTPLRLEAPAGRRPSRGSLRLVARHAGRALNAGSPVPSVAPPGAGVRVDGDHWVAAPAAFLPLAGEAEGSLPPLVAVRVPLRAVDDAEAAVEVRGDAAGGPGRPLAGQVVRQVAPGDAPWVTFELAEPLPVASGGAPLWISLRTTRGELRWYVGGEGAGRISADGGQTWGEVDPLLMDGAVPIVQLFHECPQPLDPPTLELRIGDLLLGSLTLAGPAASDPHEFASASPALGDALLDALGHTAGDGRVATDLLLSSRAVADLTVTEMAVDYEPHGEPL